MRATLDVLDERRLAAPRLLALALRADEAAGETYEQCVSQNCGATPAWPSYFHTDIDRVIDWVCAAKDRHDFVECVCNNCASYQNFRDWAGYTQGVCDVVGATPSSMVATVSTYADSRLVRRRWASTWIC